MYYEYYSQKPFFIVCVHPDSKISLDNEIRDRIFFFKTVTTFYKTIILAPNSSVLVSKGLNKFNNA